MRRERERGSERGREREKRESVSTYMCMVFVADESVEIQGRHESVQFNCVCVCVTYHV